MQMHMIRRRVASRALVMAAAAAVVSMPATFAVAGLVYWDPTNTTTAGTGSATPSGTWGTGTASWGDAAGTATPVVWNNANADTAVFAAGADATGTYTATTNTGISLAGITMEEGVQVNVSPGGTALTLTGPNNSMVVDVQTGLLVVNGRYTGNLITKTGAGIFNSGTAQTATFAGKWAVTGGSLAFGADLRIGLVPAATQADTITVSNGGKFRTGAATPTTAIDAKRGMTIGLGGGGFNTDFDIPSSAFLTTIWNGPITGSVGGDLQMSGLGTVVLTNPTNNWDGGTTVSAGNLTVGASEVIPNTSVVTQTGGNFNLTTSALNETVKSIAGTGGTIILGGNNTLTLDNPAGENAAQTLNVPDGAKIIKNGPGALTLSGGSANNNAATGFRGEFILNAGTLGVGTATMLGGNNTPSAALTINGGKLSNSDAADKNLNASLITNLNGDFTVDNSLFATPGVIRFNGGTATIKNSNRTITVTGSNTVLDLAGTVAQDVAGRSLTKTGNGRLILSGANTYTGGTNANGGTLVIANPDALNTGVLTIADTATARVQAGLPKAVAIASVTTAGTGKLDLTNNAVVVKSSNLAAVDALVTQGYNNGDWLGGGIASSTAATDPSGLTAVGFVSNADLGATTFKGVTGLDSDDVLLKYTYYGDSDLNGVVDPDDFNSFLAGFQDNTLPRTWVYGDFDYNNVIDPDDFNLFLAAFQNNGAPLSELVGMIEMSSLSRADQDLLLGAVSAVPEPTSLGLLGLAAGGLLARRRR